MSHLAARIRFPYFMARSKVVCFFMSAFYVIQMRCSLPKNVKAEGDAKLIILSVLS